MTTKTLDLNKLSQDLVKAEKDAKTFQAWAKKREDSDLTKDSRMMARVLRHTAPAMESVALFGMG